MSKTEKRVIMPLRQAIPQWLYALIDREDPEVGRHNTGSGFAEFNPAPSVVAYVDISGALLGVIATPYPAALPVPPGRVYGRSVLLRRCADLASAQMAAATVVRQIAHLNLETAK